MCFSSEELREYFSKHGDIESINVKTDPNTGRSRGFAFIVFNIPEAIDKVGFCDYAVPPVECDCKVLWAAALKLVTIHTFIIILPHYELPIFMYVPFMCIHELPLPCGSFHRYFIFFFQGMYRILSM